MGPRLPLTAGIGIAVHVLDHRDEEAEGLAGAGGGGGENVRALKRRRNRLGLHGRRRHEAGGAEAVLQRVGDVEVVEVNVLQEGKVGRRIDLDLGRVDVG